LLAVHFTQSVAEAEGICNRFELIIANGVYVKQVGGLFFRFNKSEGFIDISACTVNYVKSPDNKAVVFNLFSGCNTDLVVAANLPGKNTYLLSYVSKTRL